MHWHTRGKWARILPSPRTGLRQPTPIESTLAWLRRRLAACGAAVDGLSFTAEPFGKNEKTSLRVHFDYADKTQFFRWMGDLATGQALFEAHLGAGTTRLSAAVSLLKPESALSEAMFF